MAGRPVEAPAPLCQNVSILSGGEGNGIGIETHASKIFGT
jgi:hypothetical protein